MPPIPATPGTAGINAPHPNEEENPEDFFGDDPEASDEPSLMPEDDDHAAGEPEQPAATEASTAAEEPAAQPAPKPSTGELIPGQQLTGDGVVQAEVGADGEKIESPTNETEPDAGAEEQPAPVADPPSAPSAGEQTAPPAGASAAGAAAVKNGPRGYVVIREVTLTKEYLEHFAKQLEDGKDPFTVFMVLEAKVEARNPAPVLTNAFKKHHKRLGEPLRLAAIPLSTWKVRSLSLKPKVIDDNIAIED